MTRLVSLALVTLMIIFLGITFFQVIAPFLLPLFLAGIIAMLVQPMQAFYERKTKGRTQLAAGLTTGSVLVGISVPVVLVVLIVSFQVVYLVGDVLEGNDWTELSQSIRTELDIDQVVERLHPFATSIDEDITKAELKDKLIEFRGKFKDNLQTGLKLLVDNTLGVANKAVGFLGSLASLTVSFLMFVIALYYFLADGPALVATSENLIPIGVEYQRQLRSRFHNVVRAVVFATFLAAIGQGLATALMLCFYFGFRQFMILFLFATFASMVPLFGTWLVWGPCVVLLAFNGVWVPAIIFTVIGVGFIGMLDNLIRTYVLQSDAQLHPLLAFTCILGGVQVMGLWGVFIAPIVAAILHALIVIFNTEITEISNERIVEKLLAQTEETQTDPPNPAESDTAAARAPEDSTDSAGPNEETPREN